MDAAFGDIIEEVRFYLAQSMAEEARGALARAEALSPNSPVLLELRTQLAVLASTPRAAAPAPVKPVFVPEPSDPMPPAKKAPIAEFPVAAPARPQPEVDLLAELMPPVGVPQAKTASAADLLPGIPSGGIGAHSSIPVQATPTSGTAATNAAVVAPNGAGAKPKDVLGGMVLDLEQSLGADFSVAVSNAASKVPQTCVTNPVPARAPTSLSPLPSIAAAASSALPDSKDSVLEAFNGDGDGLAGLFAEFKHDLEQNSADTEDPETHYNLGVAFKEMGLLDEAIGELQKVCKAIERGQTFSQTIQAYTWLADCFVQKGVPEAGVHWYQKALHVPGVGDENALAMHYELACAHEAAGDIPAAREHFMHVLSRNIDYRDVAERIKALKS
jgi:hypothetical protein